MGLFFGQGAQIGLCPPPLAPENPPAWKWPLRPTITARSNVVAWCWAQNDPERENTFFLLFLLLLFFDFFDPRPGGTQPTSPAKTGPWPPPQPPISRALGAHRAPNRAQWVRIHTALEFGRWAFGPFRPFFVFLACFGPRTAAKIFRVPRLP